MDSLPFQECQHVGDLRGCYAGVRVEVRIYQSTPKSQGDLGDASMASMK